MGPEKGIIYLYMHNNDYDVITKMPGFFACNYYCHMCNKAYNNYEEHLCPNQCKCCRFFPICPKESWLTCQYCHRLFKSQQCFKQHRLSRGNVREVEAMSRRLICCTKCQKIIRHCKQLPEKRWVDSKSAGSVASMCETQRGIVAISNRKPKRKKVAPEGEEMAENGYALLEIVPHDIGDHSTCYLL